MTDDAAPDQPVPKLALTRTECAQAMGVGVRSIDTLIAGRRGNGFPVCRVGNKPIIPVGPLRDWLARSTNRARQ